MEGQIIAVIISNLIFFVLLLRDFSHFRSFCFDRLAATPEILYNINIAKSSSLSFFDQFCQE
jgi:hypothetical protein